MRVLQVNKLYAPWIGGIEAVVQDIAEGLTKYPDTECEVLVCRDRGSSSAATINGVKVTRVGSFGRFMSMPVAPKFSSQLRSMASKFDLVHVHTPFPLAMLCDWREIRNRGVQLVIHYHSDVVRRAQRAVLAPFQGWTRRMMEAADRIIVTSEGLLKHSSVLAPYRAKCRVIPLSIDLDLVKERSACEIGAAREHYGLDAGDRVVLFAGRLVYYKGVHHLIEAVRELDVKVLIAGDGALRPSLEKLVRRLGLGQKVTILGRITDEELAVLYSIADLFVLPSTEPSEAFGIVQLEAMARGLPVINTSLRSGVPSVSIHGQTGLTVPPRDVPALRDAVHTLAFDEELREQFSFNARQRVLLFSRPLVLSQIRSLYEELLPVQSRV